MNAMGKNLVLGVVAAVALASASGMVVLGQSAGGDADIQRHVDAARAAAGKTFPGLFEQLCVIPANRPRPAAAQAAQAPAAAQGRAGQPRQIPDVSTWHVEPAKVFDNLYFVGQSEFSAWAITTSAGIILMDTIFDYSVEDEVVGGLKKLGLDPAQIKIVIVSHAHGDHSGGAKYLQEHFGAHVYLSSADWELLGQSPEPKPKFDRVILDGQKVTLGDETLTMYATPGHTLGTISTLIPVKDRGQPHLVAEWGGTLYNWMQNRGAYITAEKPDRFWFDTYIASARRFRDIATKAGADVVISNHTIYDESKTKIPELAQRGPNAPNPYVVGKEAVGRYLTVAAECATANELRTAQ